jgi:hypothetical protein
MRPEASGANKRINASAVRLSGWLIRIIDRTSATASARLSPGYFSGEQRLTHGVRSRYDLSRGNPDVGGLHSRQRRLRQYLLAAHFGSRCSLKRLRLVEGTEALAGNPFAEASTALRRSIIICGKSFRHQSTNTSQPQASES